jgi:hypothetical protein
MDALLLFGMLLENKNDNGSVEFWLLAGSRKDQWFNVFFEDRGWGRGTLGTCREREQSTVQRERRALGFLQKAKAITGAAGCMKVLLVCRARKQAMVQCAHCSLECKE